MRKPTVLKMDARVTTNQRGALESEAVQEVMIFQTLEGRVLVGSVGTPADFAVEVPEDRLEELAAWLVEAVAWNKERK